MDEIAFREEFGLWWPTVEGSEAKLYHYMLNRVTDVDLAVKHCRTKGVAVQAGGFIGMWPMRLAKFFERVFTFEPMPVHYECVYRNVKHLPGVFAVNAALGPECGYLQLAPKRGGCTRASPDGALAATMVSIDSLNLPRCDAIFLDIERGELPALAGATKTIKAFSPVITVEFKEDTVTELHKWMKERKYEQVEQVHGDMIFARTTK
jgi:FkbM family methyltransferase